MDNESIYEQIVSELRDTYKKKNHDYGDSFTKSFSEFGLISVVVRMSDKLERLKTLCRNEAQVSESIRDTVMDLANYAIMSAVELFKIDNDKKK